MRADNTAHLITAAKNRSETTMTRALAAVESAERAGAAVTLTALARTAGVSRAWIYAQPELRARLQPLLEHRPTVGARILKADRATDSSLRTRLELALRRNRDLADENTRLRLDLANALARIRSIS